MRCPSLLLALVLSTNCVHAEETAITVRVIAKNAQYIGDIVDGAFVTITDAVSGEMLAQGVTSGDAGNPKRTMQTNRRRGEPMSAGNDAKYAAVLDIDEPRYIQVTAYGPLAKQFSANRASATQWVVPGKHITGGDGWVLELPGLLVLPNLEASTIPISTASRNIVIEAEVMPMCGCPVKPGFHWDPEDYEVAAIVHRGENTIGQFPLRYAGTASDFETNFTTNLPGVYDISVYAYDSKSGNTGVGQLRLTVVTDD